MDYLAGDNSIFISEPVARELGARLGDDLVLEVITQTGQKNTGLVVVKGIIHDKSIFGYYKCFVQRTFLNNLLVYGPRQCSTIGLYFKDLNQLYEKTEILYNALKRHIPMGPQIKIKEDLTRHISASWKGIRYFTFPLHVYVSQVSDLLTAMKIISYFLYIIMIIIIVVSIFVTYRLILHERSAEIGTMSAIGFTIGDIQIILILESLFLFVISLLIGYLLSLVTIHILSLFSYSWIPGFEIFLYKGTLTAHFSFKTLCTNVLILLLCILPAVWIPSFQVTRRDLISTLSGDHT